MELSFTDFMEQYVLGVSAISLKGTYLTMNLDKQAKQDIHLSGYQARDYDVVDYHMTELPGTGLQFRGPVPEAALSGGDFFACIGAAQTFGCFCEEPYPDLIGREIGLPALNLGYGGAGPEFFLKQDSLLPYLNRARFVILQVMSARSQSNQLYDCDGLEYVRLRQDGRHMGAAAAFTELLCGPMTIHNLPLPFRVRRKLANLKVRPRARAIVSDLREAWIRSSLELIERIEVPVILLWYSKRAPAYHEGYATHSQLFGEFPHMVTPQMLAPLKPNVAAYVEVVTSVGSPQPLFSRFTGKPTTVNPANDRSDLAVKPWSENLYYPSPEMHHDVVSSLLNTPEAIAVMRNKP
uniref:DUF6473 family protein n=1 Tax=Roseovarius sp. BRH_c41 TaxID=1629709 RepID=UPI0025F3BD4E|nr:DUF6473 family protein [Roseovarius sp. BRH_c41]